MHKQTSPIGVFDSGIGGLSVLNHLRQLLPHESFIYFADSEYAPYGDKTEEQIKERCLKITHFLIAHQIKALVVACNTATAAAIHLLRTTFPDLIIIGIEPGLKPAANQSQTKKIGVLATKRTLESEKFLHLSTLIAQQMQVQFIPQACVGLVNLIEQGDIDSINMMQLLHQYIDPLQEQGVDTLVLGCTHYPFVATQIEQVIFENRQQNKQLTPQRIQLIDTGLAVSKQLQTQLKQNALLAQETQQATIELWNTKSIEASKLKLNHLIQNLEKQTFKTIAL